MSCFFGVLDWSLPTGRAPLSRHRLLRPRRPEPRTQTRADRATGMVKPWLALCPCSGAFVDQINLGESI